jgi:hypothetical protein
MNDSIYEEWRDHFIEINSDWGRVGNIYWSNSITMPHPDPYTYQRITYWGCFIPRTY